MQIRCESEEKHPALLISPFLCQGNLDMEMQLSFQEGVGKAFEAHIDLGRYTWRDVVHRQPVSKDRVLAVLTWSCSRRGKNCSIRL